MQVYWLGAASSWLEADMQRKIHLASVGQQMRPGGGGFLGCESIELAYGRPPNSVLQSSLTELRRCLFLVSY